MGYRAIIAGGGTGGHLYPALNLGEALQRRSGGGMEILFVGARRGIEARVFAERSVRHRLLPMEPIYRSRLWRNWRLLPSVVRSSRAILRLFDEFRPDLVLGTGGYAAGPVVAWAALRGARTAIQEQNSYPGITTRWLARYVDQVHLGYEEAMSHLRAGADTLIRVHGNPIRWPQRRPDAAASRRELGLRGGRVVLVVGGSQGSEPLNRGLLAAIEEVNAGRLPAAPPDVELLWSTGPAHHAAVTARLEQLNRRVPVRTTPYVGEMEKALSVATLALSRAGALALAEFCAWGVPSVLVPLPHAAAGHQLRNARALEAAGAAMVVPESTVTGSPAELWRTLVQLLNEPERLQRMQSAAEARGRPRAAEAIADDLWRLMEAA